MVVWFAVIAVVIIFLLISALISSLIFIPLLPLFIQVWILELLTEADMALVLPIANIVLLIISVRLADLKPTDDIGIKEAGWFVIGLVTLFLGAGIFGAVWEQIQLAQQYHVENTSALFGSPCRSTVTMCLINDGISPYSGHFAPAILAGAMWYFGILAIRRAIISE